jgi:hypothetical protein
MAARKSQPFIEPLRIDAAVVRQQFDQDAAFGARLPDRPLHQLLADAAAATMPGYSNILDQGARGALRTQSWQYAKLQASDNRAAFLGDDELDVRVSLDRLEAAEIRWRQRFFNPFAPAAEGIVRQHADDNTDIVATGAPNGGSR